MGFSEVVGLLSGVALFLFGMTLMGDGLKRVSGDKLEPILYKLSSSPIRGLLLGTGVTTVIQSSSATSVMAVGFVNAGMMKTRQGIPIILGAILGTSITGWIICLSYIEGGEGIGAILSTATLTGFIAVIGVILRVFSKKQSHHHIGDIMMGFAILMFGMSTMSGACRGLGDEPWFTSMLSTVENPLLGIIVGCIFCAILQSSSAAVGIVQALSVTGAMSFGSCLPLLMGMPIGASLPVLLSALGATVEGKRTALTYLVGGTIGVAVCGVLFYALNAFMAFPFMADIQNPFSVAFVNTVLRLAIVVLLLPMVGVLEKIDAFFIRDKAVEAGEELAGPVLERRFLTHPALALEQSRSAIIEMAAQASEAVNLAMGLLRNYQEERYERVKLLEEMGDKYEDAIGSYLMELTRSELSEKQSQMMSIYLNTLSDFERISDHALSVAHSAADAHVKGTTFSETAYHECSVLGSAVYKILAITNDAFASDDAELAKRVEPLEEVIDELCDEMKLLHVERLKARECTIPQGTIYNDLIVDLERVADHCSNIAVAIIELHEGFLGAHEYFDRMREMSTPAFDEAYHEYRARFSLQGDLSGSVPEEATGFVTT